MGREREPDVSLVHRERENMTTLLQEIKFQMQFVPGKVTPFTEYVRVDTVEGSEYLPCNKIMNAIKLAFATGKFEGAGLDIVHREETEFPIHRGEMWRAYECRNGKPVVVENHSNMTIYGESID